MSKMIQLRNVSDELHRKLKVRAAASGRTLSDYLIGEVAAIVERPSTAEIRERLLRLGPARVRESAARAVRAEREGR